MNIIIVEDEKHARDHLSRLLLDIYPNIHIQAQMDTVKQTVQWLQKHITDLIFLDIHLADDLCFKIFEQIQVSTPVIFITAYDQYMQKAFEVNSVQYLLKPLEKGALARALEKYKNIHQKPPPMDYKALIPFFQQKKTYQKRFIGTRGSQMASIKVENIAYFEADNKDTYVITKQKQKYFVDEKLKDLENILDPVVFFRANRSFVIHIDSISHIQKGAKGRLVLTLEPSAKRIVSISADKSLRFKKWLKK